MYQISVKYAQHPSWYPPVGCNFVCPSCETSPPTAADTSLWNGVVLSSGSSGKHSRCIQMREAKPQISGGFASSRLRFWGAGDIPSPARTPWFGGAAKVVTFSGHPDYAPSLRAYKDLHVELNVVLIQASKHPQEL